MKQPKDPNARPLISEVDRNFCKKFCCACDERHGRKIVPGIITWSVPTVEYVCMHQREEDYCLWTYEKMLKAMKEEIVK